MTGKPVVTKPVEIIKSGGGLNAVDAVCREVDGYLGYDPFVNPCRRVVGKPVRREESEKCDGDTEGDNLRGREKKWRALRTRFAVMEYEMLVAEKIDDGNDETAHQLGDEVMYMRVLHKRKEEKCIEAQIGEGYHKIGNCLRMHAMQGRIRKGPEFLHRKTHKERGCKSKYRREQIPHPEEVREYEERAEVDGGRRPAGDDESNDAHGGGIREAKAPVQTERIPHPSAPVVHTIASRMSPAKIGMRTIQASKTEKR